MLHGVSTKLSRLERRRGDRRHDRRRARLLIDYHNCRVFVRDGDDLRLIAFRGDLTASGSAMDVLQTRVGEGVTGHVALTGEPFLTGDAANCGIGLRIAGTPRIEESLLAVPLRQGHRRRGDRRVEARSRPVRLRRPAPARGAGRPRLVALRERAPLRLAASRGREREGVARADPRAVGGHEPRRRATAGRRGAQRIMESRRCSIWLPTLDGGLVCRAAVGDEAYTLPWSTMLPPDPRGAVLDPRRAVRHLGRGGGAAAPGCVRRRGRGQARGHVHPPRPGPRGARGRDGERSASARA